MDSCEAPSEDNVKGDEEAASHSVHLSGLEDELSIFDDMLITNNNSENNFVEQSDIEWLSNHLSASLSADSCTSPKYHLGLA